MVKLTRIKMRMDRAIMHGGKTNFQMRCVECGRACMRRGGTSPVLHSVGEIPTGVIDGQNQTFALGHVPITNTLEIQIDGVTKFTSFQTSGNTIVLPIPLPVGAKLTADYLYVG